MLLATSVDVDLTTARVLVAAAILALLWRSFLWARRIETSVKKTEQHTNGELDSKFEKQQHETDLLKGLVADLTMAIDTQAKAITKLISETSRMAGELAVLKEVHIKGDTA